MPNSAILTTFANATNTRPARIRAASGDRVTFHAWDYGLNVDDNHTHAAIAHADRFGITGELVHASTPDDRGYVFLVLASDAVSMHI